MHKLLLMSVLALFFVSCGHQKDAKSFKEALEASSGDSYSIAKLYTVTGDYVVYKNNRTGEYEAYNMKKWDRKNMSNYSQFLGNATEGVDIVKNLVQNREWVSSGYYESVYEYHTYYYETYDSYCDCYVTESYTESYYVGEVWVDTSHWDTFYYGGGFRFDNTSSQSKDLETFAALKEEVAEKFLTYKLTSEFSLSANRASELAKLASRYQKLESVRELTASEKDSFALEALGVSYSQVESAIKAKAEGSTGQYSKLLDEASKVNNTTPEQMGRFFDEIVLTDML